MYKVSTNFRNVIYNGEADYMPHLTINGIDISYLQIEKMELSSPIIDTTSEVFYIGSFVSQKLTITFRNTEGIPLEGNVDLEIGAMVDGDYEYVPMGHYVIDTPKEDFYTKSELVCYDNGIKFKPNVDYSIALEEGKITVENLLKWLCEHFGVQLGTYPTEHPNLQKTISSYDNTISGKRYISWIAELLGCNAKINRDGELCLIPLLNTNDTIEIDVPAGKSWEVKEKYKLERVVFDNGVLYQDLSENEDEEVTGNTLYLRNENLFIQEEDFEERVQNIYDSIIGFEIWSIKHENIGDISLDCWDIVDYNVDGVVYKSYYDNILTYKMSIMAKIEVTIPSKQTQQTTNNVELDARTAVKSVKTTVDQLNGELRNTITNVQELHTTVENDRQEILDKFNGYVPESELVVFRQEMTQTLTDTLAEYAFKRELHDGTVDVVQTGSTSVDIDGVTVRGSEYHTESSVTPNGLIVKDTSNPNENLLFAGYDEELQDTVVQTNNLTVATYFTVAGNSRIERYAPENDLAGAGIFWVGD